MKLDNTKKKLARLLSAEGKEFIDRSSMKNGEFLIDLRALYEIADIAIFAISFLQRLGKGPEICTELDPKTSQLEMILNMGELSGGIRMWSKDGLAPRYVVDEVQLVTKYALTLIRSFGLDPAAVCMEKIGHNIARYPAINFQKGKGGYGKNRKKCKQLASTYNLEELFYSPPTSDEENPVYIVHS